MKICWDNLRDLKFTKNGNFVFKGDLYIEKDACSYCGESFLCLKYREQEYCCKACGKIGKARDEETKEKVSRTRIEKGVAKGKNNPMFGTKRILSFETKKKISEKLSLLRSGEDNTMYGRSGPLSPTWKGGISCEPYCQDWTKEYKEFIKERDGYRCLNPYCHKIDNKLHIHHTDYNKKNCHPSNLITVCRSCNSRANKDRNWHKVWYQAILYRRYNYEYK